MRATLRQRLWLCLPPLTFCLLDHGLTVVGQPEAYWSGDYGAAIEFSPVVHGLLTWHPVAYLTGLLLLMSLYALVISSLPSSVSAVLSWSLTMLHSLAASTWMMQVAPYAVVWALFALTGELLSCACRRRVELASKTVAMNPGSSPT